MGVFGSRSSTRARVGTSCNAATMRAFEAAAFSPEALASPSASFSASLSGEASASCFNDVGSCDSGPSVGRLALETGTSREAPTPTARGSCDNVALTAFGRAGKGAERARRLKLSRRCLAARPMAMVAAVSHVCTRRACWRIGSNNVAERSATSWRVGCCPLAPASRRLSAMAPRGLTGNAGGRSGGKVLCSAVETLGVPAEGTLVWPSAARARRRQWPFSERAMLSSTSSRRRCVLSSALRARSAMSSVRSELSSGPHDGSRSPGAGGSLREVASVRAVSSAQRAASASRCAAKSSLFEASSAQRAVAASSRVARSACTSLESSNSAASSP
mmetsp:Transcript_23607/g.76311  ORF Transcript_23607/g.76311 Transcript_23607/m.76311 type:complete len:332 (+) Transcript_23607:673-1668(+)